MNRSTSGLSIVPGAVSVRFALAAAILFVGGCEGSPGDTSTSTGGDAESAEVCKSFCDCLVAGGKECSDEAKDGGCADRLETSAAATDDPDAYVSCISKHMHDGECLFAPGDSSTRYPDDVGVVCREEIHGTFEACQTFCDCMQEMGAECSDTVTGCEKVLGSSAASKTDPEAFLTCVTDHVRDASGQCLIPASPERADYPSEASDACK